MLLCCLVVIRTIETRLVPYSSRVIELPVPSFEEPYTAPTPAAASADKNAAAPVAGRKRRLTGKGEGEHIVAKKDDEIRGHTAFLTFASKFFV